MFSSSARIVRRGFTTATTVKGFTGAIGNTPLIQLEKLSQETGCTILGKAEFQNPGGSVKDRAALYVVKDAEEKVSSPVAPWWKVLQGIQELV